MALHKNGETNDQNDSLVIKYLRQLGDDIGPDTLSGKALKSSGTIMGAYRDWQLSLASNTKLPDIVWKAARTAWRSPVSPTNAEMAQFRSRIASMLAVDDERRGTLFQRFTFRTRPQPLILMRLLSEQNLSIGPWLAMLVAAVHAGAATAVEHWAHNALLAIGFESAEKLGLDQEEVFVLLQQAKKAAEAFLADLKAVATNAYWRKVPQAPLSGHIDSLPPFPHREVASDWWRDITDHYQQHEMPVFRLDQPTRKGIAWDGRYARNPAGNFVVIEVEQFFERVEKEFIKPLESQDHEIDIDRILEEGKKLLQSRLPQPVFSFEGINAHKLHDCLIIGIEAARKNLVPRSRVVVLEMQKNIAALFNLGATYLDMQPDRPVASTRGGGKRTWQWGSLSIESAGEALGYSQSMPSASTYKHTLLCTIASGTFARLHTIGAMVCAQTAVGLFVPKLDGDLGADAVRWSLEAMQLDHLDSGATITYDEEIDLPVCHSTAGQGPFLNRPVSNDDTISGVVVVNGHSLEALCSVRGVMVVANYGRILAAILSMRRPLSYMGPCDIERCKRPTREQFGTVVYITPDIILEALQKGQILAHSENERKLVLCGSHHDWQVLALATTSLRVIAQGASCDRCTSRTAKSHKSRAIIAGTGETFEGDLSSLPLDCERTPHLNGLKDALKGQSTFSCG